MLLHGFFKSALDHSFFIFTGDGINITTWLLIYVDDIIVTGNDPKHISWLKSILMNRFKMDLVPLHYFLGVEIDSHPNRLTLTQRNYTLDILTKSRMKNCKPVITPSILNHKISTKEGDPYFDPTYYINIVGMLQYLTFTRPDIIYMVNYIYTHWLSYESHEENPLISQGHYWR